MDARGAAPKALPPDQQGLAVKLYREKQHTIAQISQLLAHPVQVSYGSNYRVGPVLGKLRPVAT